MRVHISLNVASLARSGAFYSSLFGQPPSKKQDGYMNFRLDTPPIHLALMEHGPAAGAGPGHLGIEVPDPQTLSDWRERLASSGLVFAVEDDAKCCYARADKLWLQDPDGYRWEIWVRTGEHGAMGDSKITEQASQAENRVCCR